MTQITRPPFDLRSLEQQLRQENPVLLHAVQRVRDLDRIAHRMGALPRDKSFANRISWWPLVSILGTFSAGKSSFINHYLGETVQRTGNQAVDDKFTVICFGKDQDSKVLPGVSLDADLRFPFFRISRAIEKVAPGEGQRIDAYLQLKTSGSARLRGKILIDSPGFDADRQRTATLRITEHIIDLSDLVLVFFDARHPEPGAMRDTLQHLVREIQGRSDTAKFVFVLNQMDTTAKENNPEEVVAAWQRAMGEAGFSGSDFYCIYNPSTCVPIDDEDVRRQYETKRDKHLASIYHRLEDVDVTRSYRIVGTIDGIIRSLSEVVAPRLSRAVASWRRLVLMLDASLLVLVLALGGWLTHSWGYWNGLSFEPPWWETLTGNAVYLWGSVGLLVVLALFVHGRVRRLAARFVRNRLVHDVASTPALQDATGGDIVEAFDRSTGRFRSVFCRRPRGWTPGAERKVAELTASSHELVQKLNDHYADPAGAGAGSVGVQGQAASPDRAGAGTTA